MGQRRSYDLHGIAKKHTPAMLATVILGEQQYATPRPRRGSLLQLGTSFDGLRRFKCHSWANAKPALLRVIQEMQKARDAGPP